VDPGVIDLVLAILHHLLVFGMFATATGEFLLLRTEMSGRTLDLLARIDRALGIHAVLIVIVGILRVIFGMRGYQYYVANPYFWAKMASFVAAAIVSILPTLRFLAWQRRRKADENFLPDREETRKVRDALLIERVLLFLVIIFAATMARYT
jgi:putative membrane protein